MPRGGARPGAGRKKSGMRRANAEAVANAQSTGEMPLEYMLRVMRDKRSKIQRRDDMAKAAAPFLHNKLSAIEHTGPKGGPIQVRRVERVVVDPANAAADPNTKGVPPATPPRKI